MLSRRLAYHDAEGRAVGMRSDVSAVGKPSRAKLGLLISLFFFFAGNIPPIDAEDSAIVGPGLRAGGVFIGMLLLLWLVRRFNVVGSLRALKTARPLLPLLAFCFISVLWSQLPQATVVRSIETTLAVAYTVLWAFVASRLIRDERRVFNIIAGAMVLIAIQGLLVNVVVAGTPLRIVLLREGTDRLRLVFGYLHPLAVGDMLAIGIIGLCGGKLRLFWKAALGLPLLYLLKLTDSTAALLLAVMIGFGLLVTYTGDPRALAIRWLLAVLVLLIAGVTIVVGDQSMLNAIGSDQRLWTMTGRVDLWQAIDNAGLANTWLGTGFDASREAIGRIFGTAFNSHNGYLAVLVDLGYVGLGLFIIFMLCFVWRMARRPTAIGWAFGFYCLGVGITNPLLLKANTLFPLMLAFAWPAFAEAQRRVARKLRHASRQEAYGAAPFGFVDNR